MRCPARIDNAKTTIKTEYASRTGQEASLFDRHAARHSDRSRVDESQAKLMMSAIMRGEIPNCFIDYTRKTR